MFLVDVSDIFIFVLLAEGGEGVRSARTGGGIGVSLKVPAGGGGVFPRRGRGREGACGESGNWGGGGLNFFFGPEMSPKY